MESFRAAQKRTIWLSAGAVCYSGCQFLTYVLLARVGGAAVLGLFALGTAIAVPLLSVFQATHRTIVISREGEIERFGVHVILRLLGLPVALAILLCGILIGGYAPASILALMLIASARAVESMSDIYYAPVQAAHRADRMSISMGTRGILSLVAVVVVFAVSHSLVAAATGLVAVCVLMLLFVDVPNAKKECAVHWRMFTLREAGLMIFDSAPLIITAALVALSAAIPRYAVGHFLGPSGVGYLSALETMVTPGYLLMNAIGQASAVRLARSASVPGRREYWRYTSRMLAVALGLALAGIVLSVAIGPWILSTVFGREFAEASPILPWVTAAAGVSFAVSAMGFAIVALGEHKSMIWRFFLSCGIVAGTAMVAVPKMGLLGAAIAVLVGHTASFTLLAVLLAAKWRDDRGGEIDLG